MNKVNVQTVDQLLQQAQFRESFKVLPKGDTFRPIMTFNRKIPHSKKLTTNKKL